MVLMVTVTKDDIVEELEVVKLHGYHIMHQLVGTSKVVEETLALVNGDKVYDHVPVICREND